MKKVAVLFFVLIACTGAAWAQTPDGEPPAVEGVCDHLEGDAFGLCNAYCEAMDCDSENALANERACDRVMERLVAAGGTPDCGGSVSCCGIHAVSGCDDAACEQLICDANPWCCTGGFWDGLCVEMAEAECAVCGGGSSPDELPPV